MAAPEFIRRIAIIASDSSLAATISSYFAETNRYLCVVDAPRTDREDAHNEAVRINNALARLTPQLTILAGLSRPQVEILRPFLPMQAVIDIPTSGEIGKLDGLKPERPALPCNIESAAAGLIICGREGKQLELSANGPKLTADSNTRKHLVICEKGWPVTEVIAANYALSIDADFCLIDGPGRDEAENLQRSLSGLIDLEFSDRQPLITRVTERIRGALTGIQLESRTTVTAVTQGTPYGIAISGIPTTHLLWLFLGTTIIYAILAEAQRANVRAALVVDPGKFNEPETPEILRILGLKHMHCKILTGNQATVRKVTDAVNYFPHEFLFIASHVGELTGKRWHFNFTASDGSKHIGVVDVAHSFGLIPETDKVRLVEFRRFVSLDGILHGSPEWAKLPRQLIFDYFKVRPAEKNRIFKMEDIGKIRAAAGIQLHDHNWIPLSHVIANLLHPIVFNNGCSSWMDLTERFIFGGARIYIGTVTPVDGYRSRAVAEGFLKKALDGMPLTEALWRSQMEVFEGTTLPPYVMAGCHFSTMKIIDVRQLDFLREHLQSAVRQWGRKASKPLPGAKSGTQEALNLSIKYLKELPPRLEDMWRHPNGPELKQRGPSINIPR